MFELPVVVIDEQANTNFMPVLIFTEREGFTHEIGTALSQCVVEALDVGCLTCFFAHGTMTFLGQYAGRGVLKIGGKDGSFTIVGWQ